MFERRRGVKFPLDLIEVHAGDNARKSVEQEAREAAMEEGKKRQDKGLRRRRVPKCSSEHDVRDVITRSHSGCSEISHGGVGLAARARISSPSSLSLRCLRIAPSTSGLAALSAIDRVRRKQTLFRNFLPLVLHGYSSTKQSFSFIHFPRRTASIYWCIKPKAPSFANVTNPTSKKST